jgi:hypothetical protein
MNNLECLIVVEMLWLVLQQQAEVILVALL